MPIALAEDLRKASTDNLNQLATSADMATLMPPSSQGKNGPASAARLTAGRTAC
jgi:hypothetical protein